MLQPRGGLFTPYPLPDVVFGRSIITLSVTVRTVSTLIVDNNTTAKAYMLRFVNPAVPIYIGGPGVSIESGFELDSTTFFIFGMLENTRLYAIAPVDTEVRILDMGL